MAHYVLLVLKLLVIFAMQAPEAKWFSKNVDEDKYQIPIENYDKKIISRIQNSYTFENSNRTNPY